MSRKLYRAGLLRTASIRLDMLYSVVMLAKFQKETASNTLWEKIIQSEQSVGASAGACHSAAFLPVSVSDASTLTRPHRAPKRARLFIPLNVNWNIK